MNFAQGYAIGKDFGGSLMGALDKRELKRVGDEAANVQTSTNSSFGEVDPNAVYTGPNADGQMTNAEAASYGLMTPETTSTKYLMGGKSYDTAPTDDDRQRARLRAQMDFLSGDEERAAKLQDRIDRMDARSWQQEQQSRQRKDWAKSDAADATLKQITDTEAGGFSSIVKALGAGMNSDDGHFGEGFLKGKRIAILGVDEKTGSVKVQAQDFDGSLVGEPKVLNKDAVMKEWQQYRDSKLRGTSYENYFKDRTLGIEEGKLKETTRHNVADEGLAGRKVAVEEGLMPAQKAYYQSGANAHNASAGLANMQAGMGRFLGSPQSYTDDKGNEIMAGVRYNPQSQSLESYQFQLPSGMHADRSRAGAAGSKLSQMTETERASLWDRSESDLKQGYKGWDNLDRDTKDSLIFERMNKLVGGISVRGENGGKGGPTGLVITKPDQPSASAETSGAPLSKDQFIKPGENGTRYIDWSSLPRKIPRRGNSGFDPDGMDYVWR